MIVMAYRNSFPSNTVTGELVLRIHGSRRNGQIVRIRSAKCLVGSDPSCDLRLRSRYVAPLHCLILRGPGGTVVRSWSRDTRINGLAFDDARLGEGDFLSIGPINFEVLEVNSPRAEELPPRRPYFGNAATEGGGCATAECNSLSVLSAEANRGRARRVIEALRQSRAQVERLESELRSLQASRETESATSRDDFEAQRRQWQEAVETREKELAAFRTAVATKERVWAGQATRMESRIAELETALSEALQTLEASPDTSRLEAELQQQRAELDRTRDELERLEREADDRVRELERRLAERDETLRELHSRCEAEQDAFKTLRTQANEEPEQSETAAAEVCPSSSALIETSPTRLTHARGQGAEEDSIEEYMAQLLQRVRGSASSEAAWAPREEEGTQRDDIAETRQPADVPPNAATEEPHDEESVEMLPRAAAPEKETGLAAMRSLANLSAQHALGMHTRKVLTKSVRVRMLLTILALVSSGFLLKMWSLFNVGGFALWGAILSLAAASYWGGHLLVLVVRLATHSRLPEDDEPAAQ